MKKLYLRIKVLTGRRIRLIERRTTKVVPGTEIYIFPNEGTEKNPMPAPEVTDERAAEYMAQDPYLVSDKPYSEANDPSILAAKAAEKVAAKAPGQKKLTKAEQASKDRFVRNNRPNNPRGETPTEQLPVEEQTKGPGLRALAAAEANIDYLAEYGEKMEKLAKADLSKAKTKKPLQKIANDLGAVFTSKTNMADLLVAINARAEFITTKMEEQLTAQESEDNSPKDEKTEKPGE